MRVQTIARRVELVETVAPRRRADSLGGIARVWGVDVRRSFAVDRGDRCRKRVARLAGGADRTRGGSVSARARRGRLGRGLRTTTVRRWCDDGAVARRALARRPLQSAMTSRNAGHGAGMPVGSAPLTAATLRTSTWRTGRVDTGRICARDAGPARAAALGPQHRRGDRARLPAHRSHRRRWCSTRGARRTQYTPRCADGSRPSTSTSVGRKVTTGEQRFARSTARRSLRRRSSLSVLDRVRSRSAAKDSVSPRPPPGEFGEAEQRRRSSSRRRAAPSRSGTPIAEIDRPGGDARGKADVPTARAPARRRRTSKPSRACTSILPSSSTR